MNGLLGLNVRTNNVSRDQIMSGAQKIGGAWILCQDDPALVIQAKAAGLKTIYRQSGDETLATPPDVFVQTRADKGADLTYLLNEQDPTPEVLAWTQEAIDYATSRGIKLCIFNFATDRTPQQWNASRQVATKAVREGHAIGWHSYIPAAGETNNSRSFLALKHDLGGLWLVTEHGYSLDAYHGWRGTLNPQQYGSVLNQTLALFSSEHMPVLLFSGDNWPSNTQGKASGFGVLDNADMLNQLALLNAAFPLAPPNPPIPTPSPLRTALVIATTAPATAPRVNVRPAPNTTQPPIGTLGVGDTVRYNPTPIPGGSYSAGGKTRNDWYALDHGYVACGVIQLKP